MRIVATLMLAVVVLASCGSEAASGPPDMKFGRDICDQCGMIISEPRFASAYRDAGGKPFIFDDIADMVVFMSMRERPADDRVWVHDYETEEWLVAADAWFVRGRIATPMNGGIVAFSSEAAARTFADEREGRVLRWAHVLDEPIDFMMHSHSSP